MKANKFNAKKTAVDGHTFDSKAEASRYIELKMLKKAKKIDRLELQPTFSLHVDGELIGKYRADFLYIDLSTGEEVVEDCNPKVTDVHVAGWTRRKAGSDSTCHRARISRGNISHQV